MSLWLSFSGLDSDSDSVLELNAKVGNSLLSMNQSGYIESVLWVAAKVWARAQDQCAHFWKRCAFCHQYLHIWWERWRTRCQRWWWGEISGKCFTLEHADFDQSCYWFLTSNRSPACLYATSNMSILLTFMTAIIRLCVFSWLPKPGLISFTTWTLCSVLCVSQLSH